MGTTLGRLPDGVVRTAEGSDAVLRVGAWAVFLSVGVALRLGLEPAVVGDVEGRSGAAGRTAGGARGTVGVVGGEDAVRCSGRATSTATAQVTPAPAAARTSRRRLAARRISS
ncbi:hypothetical protein AB5J52_02265 [Streptomyces sp. R39]|uniref:Uncharacterized protein n=1 Tax=Streptomyces sp. R39 TaxID=3238631 RepID=A0AB39QD74_9ACTN